MFNVPVNYLAVLVSGIASMIIGFVWYGPLFGKQWMKLVGMTNEKMEKTKKEGMQKAYFLSFVSSLVMAYVLAHFIWFSAPGSTTVTIGIKTAIWSWIGLVAPVILTGYLFATDKKPWSLLVLDSGYFLVNLLAMGIILAVF